MGGGVPRKEEPNLVLGRANWTDNIKPAGTLHFALLRSPLTHAKITSLDVSGALDRPGVVPALTGEDPADAGPVPRALLPTPRAHGKITARDGSGALDRPGVVAAFTGEDLADEWPGGVPCAATVTDEQNTPFKAPIVTDEVKYMGDVVAVVLATDRYKAQDALESIEVEYEPLGVVVDMETALEEGAPLVHGDLGTNECFTFTAGVGNVDELFEQTDA